MDSGGKSFGLCQHLHKNNVNLTNEMCMFNHVYLSTNICVYVHLCVCICVCVITSLLDFVYTYLGIFENRYILLPHMRNN